MRAKAAERQSVLFPCPFFLRKGLPLAVLFLTNQRRPTFRLWTEPELVRQRALFGIEPKFGAEQKQDQCRSHCGKHGKLDSHMVFHFRSAINAFRNRKPFFDFDPTSLKL